MRRTDRLFELIQVLRDGRLHKAQDLADKLEVSVRTIYRDMDSLVASGIPVEGERGVGYILRAPIFMPPMALTQTELEALHLGMEMVSKAADPELKQAAGRLVDKVNLVTPDGIEPPREGWGFEVFAPPEAPNYFAALPKIRRAVREKHVMQFTYDALTGHRSSRKIRPLHLEFWGRVWTCTAWCELRHDFRVFRTDRMTDLHVLPDRFSDEPGKRFYDFLLTKTDDEAHRIKLRTPEPPN